jgi:hypothetical protein
MAPGLPLDQMTVSEKLRVLEEIWDDLCRNADDVPAPDWHGNVLSARQKRVQEGASQFTAWDEAKENIRDTAK